MVEPRVDYCTMRDTEDDHGIPAIDIECRFEDGQKFAPIQVDGDFPRLAALICELLNAGGVWNRAEREMKESP